MAETKLTKCVLKLNILGEGGHLQIVVESEHTNLN